MPTPQEWAALVLSLKVAAVCVAVALIPGVALGWALARRTFPGKSLLAAVVHLPLVLPPVVVGYLLLLSLGRRGFIGSRLEEWFGLTLAFTWQGAALASALMGFPLLVRAVRLAVEMSDPRLETAARTLGASPWRTWWSTTLPLALPGVVAGAVLCFARSLGEFGATITFAGNIAGETRTLPLALYSAVQSTGAESVAWRLTVISLILAFVSLAVSELMERRVRRRVGLR